MNKFVLALAALSASTAPWVVQGDVLQLHGSGTTNPQKLLWKTMSILETRAKVPIRMTYRAVGSGTGQKEFIGNGDGVQLGNFGAGDIPFSATDYKGMEDRSQALLHIPFVMGAISFFHSIPSNLPLDLNACLLAKIFTVQITMWDDEEILSYGSNKDLSSVLKGQKINVVRRVFGSSSTSLATGYIKAATEAQDCEAGVWPENMTGKGDADKDTLKPKKAPYWNEATNGAQGSGGVTNFIRDNAFSIGYLDAGHGIAEGLSEVAIQNKDGNILTSQQANLESAATMSMEQKIIPSDLGADFSAVNLLDAPGADTWPMMTFSYLYIRQDMKAMGQSGGLVRALVEYLLSEEGQGHLAEFGFVKIPAELVKRGTDAISNCEYDAGVKQWEFELASSTIIYGGTAEHMFSGKRQNWDTYVLNSVSSTVDNHVELLGESSATTTALEGLTAKVANLESVQALNSAASEGGEAETDQDDKIQQSFSIGVAALIITLVYSVPLTVFAMKLNSRVEALETAGGSGGPKQYGEALVSGTTASGPL